jgi:hypothetical protein
MLFSMSPRLWCKSCLLHCHHQGEEIDSKEGRKEEREGTQVGRHRERERERRTIMGFASVMKI